MLNFNSKPARKERLRKLKNELGGEAMRALSDCYQEAEVQHPSDELLERLEHLISEVLREAGRTKKLRTGWQRCQAADKVDRGLRLCARIKDLLKRAERNVPVRPLAEISRFMEGAGEEAASARVLLQQYLAVRRGVRAPKVNWAELAPLLLKYRNRPRSQRRMGVLETRAQDAAAGPEKITTYAVFLELVWEDYEWVRCHQKGVLRLAEWVANLEEPELVDLVPCLLESAFWKTAEVRGRICGMQEKVKKERARLWTAKSREKKKEKMPYSPKEPPPL
jgi:hypothetical protein